MSMLRQDPLTGRWVIMAAGRQGRPNEFRLMQRDLSPGENCPFCPGRESQTTQEIDAVGRPPGAAANGPGWDMRVFPNKFPALDPAPPDVSGEGPGGLLVSRPGLGSHEVIVYSPDHAASLATITTAEMEGLLHLLRTRTEVISRRPGHRYVSAFCNHGPEAGATLAHPHMQIIGTPELPPLLVDKVDRFVDHRSRTGGCLMCDLLAAEHEDAERVVFRNSGWTALAPWASRFPYEMLLAPTTHQTCLTTADDDELSQLAEALSFCFGRLADIHGDPSVNLVVHNAPLPPAGADFHWHLEILPRLSRPAGFEVGTGFTINSVIPETAARRLRAKGS